MKGLLNIAILLCTTTFVYSQTPVNRGLPTLPSGYRVDLANPDLTNGLDKKAKKEFKAAKKAEKDRLKALNRKLDAQLDSLNLLREKDSRRRVLKDNLVRLGDIDELDIPHKEKAKKYAKTKPDSSAVVALLDEYAGDEAGSKYENISRFGIYRDSVSVLTENDSVRSAFVKALVGQNEYFTQAEAARNGQADSVALHYATDGQDLDQYLASRFLSSEQNEALTASQMSKEDLIPSMDQYFEKYGIDPENLGYHDKEQVQQKVEKLAESKYVDHFAGKEDKLLKAKSKMEVIKKKRTLKDFIGYFFDQDVERMKEMELRERFSVGGYLEYQRGNPDLLDISPVIGYKATGKITAGVGATWRKSFGGDSLQTGQLSREVLGYRLYTDYQFILGLYLHSEFESLRANVQQSAGDQFRKEWVNSFLFGLGRDFRISGNIRGSALFLYNFSYESGRTPYPRPWQFRFGIKYN